MEDKAYPFTERELTNLSNEQTGILSNYIVLKRPIFVEENGTIKIQKEN